MLKTFMSFFLGILLCSCTASRKFDFNSAYKFRYLHYNPVHATDSVPLLLVSSDKLALTPSRQPGMPELKYPEKTISAEKKTMPAGEKDRTGIKHVYRNSFTADKHSAGKTAVIPYKAYKRKSITHYKSTAGFGDLHPAFQGFIFVAAGFGLIVAGSLITGIQVLPIILIAGGIALAVFGFIKIFAQL